MGIAVFVSVSRSERSPASLTRPRGAFRVERKLLISGDQQTSREGSVVNPFPGERGNSLGKQRERAGPRGHFQRKNFPVYPSFRGCTLQRGHRIAARANTKSENQPNGTWKSRVFFPLKYGPARPRWLSLDSRVPELCVNSIFSKTELLPEQFHSILQYSLYYHLFYICPSAQRPILHTSEPPYINTRRSHRPRILKQTSTLLDPTLTF